MKKIISLSIIIILAFSLLCSCNQNNSEANTDNYNIELQTEKKVYGTDTEYINYKIINNSEDKVIENNEYEPVIEKYVDNKWKTVDLHFSDYGAGYIIDPATHSLDFSCKIYDKDSPVEKGKYRISINVDVYDALEEVTKTDTSPNDKTDTYYQYDKNTGKKITLSDEYTIE